MEKHCYTKDFDPLTVCAKIKSNKNSSSSSKVDYKGYPANMTFKKPKGRVAISLAIGPIEITQRIFLAVLMGYFFSMEVSAFLGRTLSIFIERSEAAVFSSMISFVVYILVIMWVFVDSKLSRLWVALPGGIIFLYAINTTFFV